jgi:homoaconitase/3-isopropylmalate dehydratase large subunit
MLAEGPQIAHMPGHTIAEKILAAKSGRASVWPGEIVDAYPDLVMSHTATWRSVSVMQKVGATKLYDPDRLAVVLDHIAPAKTEKNATDQQVSRNFARTNGINKFYDVDAGIAHLVLMEAGHVAPGDLIVGTDSHCTIYGSLGALGTGIGYTEVASVWITGKLWMKVPETFKIEGPDALSDRDSGRGWMRIQSRRVSWRRDYGFERFRTYDDDEPGHGNGCEMRVRAAGRED